MKESEEVITTIKDVITRDMLVFTREEAGWIRDIANDYVYMVQQTRLTSEELRGWYENFLRPDAVLPKGVTVEMIADDLERLKEDAKFFDVAEKRAAIIRDAAHDFILSQHYDDTSILPDSCVTQGATDVNIDEPVHTVSEEDTSVLSGQADKEDIPTTPATPNSWEWDMPKQSSTAGNLTASRGVKSDA